MVSITPSTYTANDFHFSYLHDTASGVAAGTYTMALSDTDFTNNNTNFTNVTFMVTPGTMTITPITTPIVITADDSTKVYDGSALADNGFTYTQGVLKDGDVLTATVAGSRTDYGQAPNHVTTYKVMNGTTDVTGSYTFGSTVDGTLTVTKRPVTLTSNGGNKVYDGSALTKNQQADIVVSDSGFVTGQGATYTITGTQTPVGTSANTFTYALSSNTQADNYTISTVNGTLTVTPRLVTVNIKGNTATKIYNGSEQNVKGYTVECDYNTSTEYTGTLYTVNDFTYAGDSTARGTLAGNYFMGLAANQFTNNNSNFAATFNIVSDGKLTIDPNNTNPDTLILVAADFVGTYDAGVHTAPSVTVSQKIGDEVHPLGIVANGGSVTLYNGTDVLKVSVTGSITNYTEGGVNNVPAVVSIMNGSTDVSASYFVKTTNGTLMLNKRPLQIQAASGSWAYDGVSHRKNSANDYAIVNGTSLADGDALQSVVLTGSRTYVGDSANVASNAVIKRGTDIVTGNYDTTYLPGTLTITPNTAVIAVTSGSYEGVYDGAAHTNRTDYAVTCNGAICDKAQNSAHVDIDTVFLIPLATNVYDTLTITPDASASVTNVGTVSNTYTVALTNASNYSNTPSKSNGSLTVTAREFTVAVANDTLDYTGYVQYGHSIDAGHTTTTGILDGHTLTIAYTPATGTQVGTYNNGAFGAWSISSSVGDVSGNYTLGTATAGKLVITPKTTNPYEINIVSNSATYIYDGTLKSVSGFEHLTFEVPTGSGHQYTVSGVNASVSQTNVGTYKNAISGTPIVTDALGNVVTSSFTVTADTGTLVINRAPAAALVLTASGYTGVYDAAAHNITASTNVTVGTQLQYSADQTTWGTTVLTATDVVTDSVFYVRAVNANYDTAYANAKVTITPKAVTVVANDANKVYDNVATNPSGYTATVTGTLNNDAIVYNVTRVAGENVGTYAITPDGAATQGNYSVTYAPGTFTITKAPLTITACTDNFTYDGDVKSCTSITGSGFKGTDSESSISGFAINGTIQYPSQSPVTTTVDTTGWTFANKGNYDITLAPGQLTMTAPTTNLAITACSGSWVYDGDMHRIDSVLVKLGTNAQTKEWVNNGNLAIELQNGDVLKVKLQGEIQHVSSTTVYNTIQSYTITHGTQDVASLYNVTPTNGTLTVTPKEVTVTAASHLISDNTNFTYDGQPHSDPACTVSGLVGTDAITATASGSITYPSEGSVDNIVASAQVTTGYANDYTITPVAGKLEMKYNPTAITITPNSASKKYDGQPLTADGYTLTYSGNSYSVGEDGYYTFNNGDRLYVDIQGSNTHVSTNGTNKNKVNVTNVSPKVMNNDVDVTGNYTMTYSAEGDLTITPRTVTLTSATDAKTYDGTPLTNTNVTETGDGFVGTEGMTYNVTGSQQVVGSSQNLFTATFNDGTQKDDYDTTKVYGTLTVNSADEVTVTITGNSGSAVYDGTEKSVNGYTIAISNSLYSVNDFTKPDQDADVATAKGTVAGTYTMALSASDFANNNTNFSNDKVHFVVTPGTLTVTPTSANTIVITAADASKTYDANALTNAGYTVAYGSNTYTVAAADAAKGAVLPTGDTVIANVQGNRIDYGQAPNSVATYKVMHKNSDGTSTDVTSSYASANLIDGTLTVNKRPVTLTSATDEKVYDGTALTNSNVTVSGDGFVTGQGAAYTITGTQTPVGTSANTFTYALISGTAADNYTISTVNGTLKVTTRSVTVKITGNTGTKIYNGSEQNVKGYTVAYEYPTGAYTGTHYTVNDFTYTGDSTARGTLVGNYDMGLAANQFTNNNSNFVATFNIVSDGKLTITPNTANPDTLILVAASYEGTYDAEPHGAPSVTVSQKIGNEVYQLGTVANGGSVTLHNGTDVMLVSVTGSITNHTEGTVYNIPAVVSITNNGVDVSNSYYDSLKKGTLVVNKRPLDIQAASDSKVYDGTPLTASGYTLLNSTSIPNKDQLVSVTVTGSQTLQGTSDNVSSAAQITRRSDNTNVTDNYAITYTNGTLTVTPNTATIAINSGNYSGVYDGQAHTNQTGYTVTYNNLPCSKAKNSANEEIDTVFLIPLATNVYDTLTITPDATATVTDATTTPVSNSYTYTLTNSGSYQYEPTATFGTLTVTPCEVTVSVADKDNVEYTGAELTGNTTPVFNNLVDNHTASIAYTPAKGILVGTYDNGAYTMSTFKVEDANQQDVTSNYVLTTATTGKLTIVNTTSPTVLTIVSKSETFNYDGTAKTVSGFNTLNFTVNEQSYTVNGVMASVTKTDVGTYKNAITGTPVVLDANGNDVTAQFTVTADTGNLVIKPYANDIYVTISGNQYTRVYDGNSYSVSGYTFSSDNALYNDANFFSCSNSTLTLTRTDAGVDSMHLLAGQFQNVNPNFDNSKVHFTIAQDGWLKITPASLQMVVTCPTEVTHVYDGAEFNASAATCNVANAKIEYSTDNQAWELNRPSITHVGTQLVYVRASHNNYDTARCQYTLEVTKRPLTVTAASPVFAYTGQTHSIDTMAAPKYTVSGLATTDNAATHTATVTGSITYPSESPKPSVASNFQFTGSYAALNADYDVTYVNGQITMTFTPTELYFTTASGVWTYSGQAHDTMTYTVNGGTTAYQSGVGVTLPNGQDVLTVTLVGNTATNVAQGAVPNNYAAYTIMNGTTDVSAQYTVTPVIGTLKINPKDVTITPASDEKVYDGTPLTNSTYQVDGLVSPNTLVAVVEGSQTAVGQSNNTVTSYTFTNGSVQNYTVTTETGLLKVTDPASPVALTITTNGHEWTYDGQAHSDVGYTLSIDGGTAITVTGETYELPNHDILTVTMPTTVTDFTTGTTNAGTVKIMRDNVEVTNDVNKYTVNKTEGSLKINKRPVTVEVTGHTAELVYNAEEQSVSGYDLACSDALFQTSTVSYDSTAIAKGTFVNTYPMNLNMAKFSTSDANFDPAFTRVSDGTLTITPREITVTAANEAFTYDGAVHNATNTLTLTNVPAVDQDKISITVSGSIQFVSESPATKHIESVNFDPTTLAANYTVTPVDGQLTMTAPTLATIHIRAIDSVWTYDGVEHSYMGYNFHFDNAADTLVPKTANGQYTLHNGDVLKVTFTPASRITGYTEGGVINEIASVKVLHGTEDVTSSYVIDAVNGRLTIDKRAASLTAKSGDYTYDGTEHLQPGYYSTNLVAGDSIIATTTAGTAGGGITYTSQSPVTNSINPIYNFYHGSADNYIITTIQGTLTMTCPDPKPAITVTATSPEWMYDGNEHTAVSDTVKINGQTVVAGADGNATFIYNNVAHVLHADVSGNITNPGTATNSLNDITVTQNGTDVTSCFSITPNDGTLTVTKKNDVEVTIVGNTATETYNGQEQTVTGYTVTNISSSLLGDTSIVCSAATAQRTHVGTTIMGLDGNFSLTPWASQFFENVTFHVTDGSLTITKTPLTITACSQNFDYDGAEHTCNTYTTEGIQTADADTTGWNVKILGSISYVSESPVTTTVDTNNWHFANKGDYDITLATGELTMTYSTAKPTVKIEAYSHTWQYDNVTHSIPGYLVTYNGTTDSIHNEGTSLYKVLANGDTLRTTVEGTIHDVIPLYPNTVDNVVTGYTITNHGMDVRDNYDVTLVKGALKVTPAPVTITGTSKTWTYDGHAHTSPACIITGLFGSDSITAQATGSITYVGETSNPVNTSYVWYQGVSTNYSVDLIPGVLKVETPSPEDRDTIWITANGAEKQYDASPLTQKTFDYKYKNYSLTEQAGSVTIPGVGTLQVNFANNSTITNVGTQPNHIQSYWILNGIQDVTNNYVLIVKDSMLKITPYPLTITAGSYGPAVYDGQTHTNSSTTPLVGTYFVGTDHLVSVDVTGEITGAGVVANVPSNAVIKNNQGTDVTGNYDITYNNGSLEVLVNNTITLRMTSYDSTWE